MHGDLTDTSRRLAEGALDERAQRAECEPAGDAASAVGLVELREARRGALEREHVVVIDERDAHSVAAARLLGADSFRATFGEWIPLGTRDPRNATLVRLGQLLTRSRRVVAHVDELDKWLVGDREWGRSLSNDLWNLLDGKLPWELVRQLAAEDEQDGAAHPAPPARPVIPGCTGQLWIVGSGTWQSVFEHRRAPQLGFGPRTSGAGDPRDLAEEIRRSKAIPTELSARFASDLLFLDYPDADETEHLLGTFGIRELAAEVGVAVSAADVDYQSAGMRALESLKTRLLLLRVRKERGAAPDPDHAAPIAAPELGI